MTADFDFDRVYGYLRMTLCDRHEAEDLTQYVFLNALVHLDHLKKKRPTLLEDPEELRGRLSIDAPDADAVRSRLAWMSESEVALLIERLPMAQRQVIVLRYLIGLTMEEIADVLGRGVPSVGALDYRARQNLRARLTVLGRRPMVRRPANTQAAADGSPPARAALRVAAPIGLKASGGRPKY